MKLRLVAIFCLVLASVSARGQYAPPDSTRYIEWNYADGQRLLKKGQGLFLSGGACTLVGASFLATPFLIRRDRQQEAVRDNYVLPLLCAIGGVSFAVVGLSTILTGIPVSVAGNGILEADDYWKNLRYDGIGQQGYGMMLDLAAYLGGVQLKASAGYHFNRRFYLGGGLGPAVDLAATNGWSHVVVNLPAYAELRYSILGRYYSPYLGAAAGYDILDRSPYLSGDIGLRIRHSSKKPQSMWLSATGEVGGSYMRVGVKMGWGF